MKKFLVLALVMGIASLASAGVELAANDVTNGAGMDLLVDPGMIVISLVSDEPATGFDALYYVLGRLADPQDHTGGMFSTIEPADQGGFKMAAGTFGNAIAPGKWFSMSTMGEVGDVISLYSASADGTAPADLLDTVTVVPEPMTMALLGLGGLFLRRRK